MLKKNNNLISSSNNIIFYISLIFSITICTFFLIYSIESVRVKISRIVKHGTICFLQNNNIIHTRRAHYTPDRGTIDIVYCSPPNPPIFHGKKMDHDIFVLSDFGHQVQRINKFGNVVWTKNLDSPRGLDSTKNYLYVGNGKELLVLDINTGALVNKQIYNEYITAIKYYKGTLFIAFYDGKSGSIKGYKIDKKIYKLIYRAPVKLQSARGIDIADDILFIADTFSHEITKIHLNSNSSTYGISYYPNSVQVLNDKILVAEEHLNLISIFSSNSLKKLKTIYECNGIISHEKKIKDINPNDLINVKTLCGVNYGGVRLFSPNDAIYDNGSLYIADTDNHRILVLKNSLNHAIISGFNNPVNIRLVK